MAARKEKPVSLLEADRRIGIPRNTLNRWVNEGKLKNRGGLRYGYAPNGAYTKMVRLSDIKKLKPAAMRRKKGPIYTYLIKAGVTGLVKIGRSCSPERRRDNLATAGIKPRILASLLGDREAEFKEKFARYKVTREWFKPARKLISAFREAARNV